MGMYKTLTRGIPRNVKSAEDLPRLQKTEGMRGNSGIFNPCDALTRSQTSDRCGPRGESNDISYQASERSGGGGGGSSGSGGGGGAAGGGGNNGEEKKEKEERRAAPEPGDTRRSKSGPGP